MIRVPAESESHAACWMAWPHLAHEWTDLAAARTEIMALIAAIAQTEHVHLLAHDDAPELGNVTIHRVAYGDSWTRDTAPIFAWEGDQLLALVGRFDGWGGKYLMPGDVEVGAVIAGLAEVPVTTIDLVLEGGAIELDGAGTLMTTRDCLEARNPGRDVEGALREAMGVDRVVWLRGTLLNDHTDGHVDTLARFVEPGRVVCMEPLAGDPNEATLRSLIVQVEEHGLQVERVPSPGVVRSAGGEILPASYCNYYLANEQILVPAYGVGADETARRALAALFPKRRARSLDARAILEGGGALHCITQHQPV